MVRYPAVDRTYAAALDELRLRTPRGEIPFHQAATVHDGRGFSEINRIDRNRGIHVLVNLDRKQITAGDLAAILDQDHLPKLREQFHGITTSYDGRQRRQSDFMGAIGAKAILALLAIFVLLAIPLRSYSQPLVIMTAIPFGIVGAFWGHVAMDMDLAIFSIIGLTALSGVVVNDSLVMVDFINQARKLGMTAREAVMESGIRRFRAISLTTLTTFAGLTPLLLEKSMQAQFIMPMAVTLAFGVVFATAVTLILVPVLYLIAEDLGNLRGARNSA
jgi:multidrug efflux pump subunit AcrB